MIWNKVWCIGRRSNRTYLRFYPNFGFMVPWFGGMRLRWSVHHGWRVTKPPVWGNPRGF